MSKYSQIRLDPYGAVFDTDPHDVDDKSYTDVLNMRFNDGAAEKIGGEVEGAATTEQATHLLFNGSHEDPLWLYFGDGIARVTNFTLDKDIEGAALTSSIDWDSSLFNTFPICNNVQDAPRFWDKDFITPGTLADLPAWPVNHLCQSIRPFRSFLVAMNITITGTGTEVNRVIWSDSSDAGALPASWDIADPATLAGDAYLTDDRGEIIDGAQLRDLFVVYKTHSTYIMRLIGGQSVMRFDKVQVNSGLLAKNCVLEFKGKHFVVADGDIVLFDGQNVESIADQRVKDTIFNNIDSENFDRTYVVRDDKNHEIWVCYPSSGNTFSDKAGIWNWRDNTWTFRELKNTRHIANGVSNFAVSPTWDSLTTTTWDSFNTTWKSFSSNPTVDVLSSAVDLAINIIGDTFDMVGAAMPSRLEKVTMDFGDPDTIKMVKSVTPRITGIAGTKVFIRLGTQFNPDDNIVWGSEQTYTIGTDREVFFTQKGRFISIRMRTQDIGDNWTCHGLFFKAATSGKY
jgi:frataxin-like iron-binding protein CyaY